MTIEQRVARLERQNRWMKRIGVVGLALVAAITVWPRSRAPKVNSLQRQVGYIQSELGIENFEFEFPFPRDKQLVATLVARLDGKVVSGLMSGVFYIPPSQKPQANVVNIWIRFFYPPYLTRDGILLLPDWNLDFSRTESSHSYGCRSPFDPREGERTISGSRSSGSDVLKSVGKDYEVWSYRTSGKQRNGKDYDFSYTLTVRLEKLKEGEELRKVTRIDLPEQIE